MPYYVVVDDSHTGSPSCIERKVSGEERCIDDGTVEGSANQADVYTSDQISLAIEKITSHIGQTSRKFLKSSELLRKLLEGSNVEAGKHGSLLFSALVASMVNPDRPLDPMLGREYYKLFCLANSRHEVGIFRFYQCLLYEIAISH